MKKDFIYLASASPRRSALLDQIGVPHRVVVPDIAENREPGEPSERYVKRLAEEKAAVIWSRTPRDEARAVLAADTTVELDGELLGKPRDTADAIRMLTALSGRCHRVLTGVALRYEDGLESIVDASEVKFRETTDAERRAYCETGEPLDKAGAYGVQGYGAVFVEWIRGSFSTVVGLPLAQTARLLGRVGQPHWLVGDARSR
jgi:septum formation protein